jgi:hypothetical protein
MFSTMNQFDISTEVETVDLCTIFVLWRLMIFFNLVIHLRLYHTALRATGPDH